MNGGTRSGSRGARALLVSLIAHAVLVLVVVRVAPRVREPPQPVVEIELREPPEVFEPPAFTGPPAPVPSVPQRPSRSPRPAAPSAPGEAPEPAPQPAPGPSLPARPPRLTLDEATVDRFTRDGIISAPPAPAPAAPARSRWQQKLALLERDTAGRKNVEDGKVHPQVYDFMRDAEKIFKPRESVVEKDPRAVNTVGRSMRAWSRGFFRNYLDQLRKLEEDEPSRKGRLAEGGSDVLAEYGRLLRAAEKGGESISCQVCLVIRPGLPPEVVLAKSSGNKEVDEAATDALLRAAQRRPYEQDLKPERACYRFAATIYRIPPLPIAGCSFDESKLKLDCFYPGMQIYRLKVRLDLVDYSDG
jgi:hypothetical protein